MKLYAPAEYWDLKKTNPHAIDDLTGGCGPGGFGDWLVPDTMYGLSVRPACEIHDFMWAIAEPRIKAKDEADRAFLNNMLRIIKAETKWRILKWLRRRRAKTYYYFVSEYGGPSFWKGKNPDAEEREAI